MPNTANAPVQQLQVEPFKDTRSAATFIGMSESWLEHDRQRSTPEIPFVRMGTRAVRYRVSDLLAYAEKQLGKPIAA